MPKILVVDDSAMTRDFLSALLSHHGYQIRVANDGLDALEKIKEDLPELVVTDLLMPIMGGYEFVESLRNDPKTQNIRVIFYTAAYERQEAMALAKACGAIAVLSKSAEPTEILETVKQALTSNMPGTQNPSSEQVTINPIIHQLKTEDTSQAEVFNFPKQDKFIKLIYALTAERSSEKMLQLACQGIRELMGATYCALAILSNDQKEIIHYYTDNKMPFLVQNEKPKFDQGLMKQLFEGKKTIHRNTLKPQEKIQLGIPELFSVSDFIALPIITNTALYGFLYLLKENEKFREDNIEILEVFVGQVAMLYEINQSFALLKRHTVSLQLEMSSYKKIEAALTSGDSIFRQFSENISDIFWVISPEQKLIYISRAFEEIWGRSLESLHSDPTIWLDGIDFRDKEFVMKQYQILIDEKKPLGMEYRVIRPDGTVRFVYDRGFPILDQTGALTHIIGITTDITNQKKIEKRSETQYIISQIFSESENLRESMTKILRTLCENFGWKFAILWMIEQSTNKLNCVASWHSSGAKMEHLEDIEKEAALSAGIPNVVVRERRALWVEDLRKNAQLPESKYVGQDKIRSACGFPVIAEGEILGVIELFTDKILAIDEGLFKFLKNIGSQIGQFTKRKYTEAQLERMAHYDVLTGLANRSILFNGIKESIYMARANDKKVAILFVDLDGFKEINDKHGHEVGDEFLKIVGERLRTRIRKPDTVARLGGDEFVIILSDIDDVEIITTVAEKILDAIAKPFVVRGNQFTLTTSIGISLYPDDGADAQTLLSKADVAMYEAKVSGGNKYQFCTIEMTRIANEKAELENAMRRGIEQNEFVLLYQPKLNLKSMKIIGVEALLYWQRPNGMVAPREFLHLAEETGLIIPLGDWVLKTACEQTKKWQTQGFPLTVSVNLSSNQLIMSEFLDSIVHTLKETHLSPESLEVELTETLLMKNLEASVMLIRALRAMGIQISIDDFGTGFSSLMYLKKFQVNRLKIDQSFVQGIPRDQNAVSIAETIVSMGHSLGLMIIAEGVETKEQLDLLVAAGCDEMQGYYFCRPVPSDQLTEFLKNPPKIL